MKKLLNNNLVVGISAALSAAALNGSIGVVSKLLMDSGLNSNDIAFLRTAIAVVFLSLLLAKTPLERQLDFIRTLKRDFFWFKAALCAFLGIFVLFYFETLAYRYGNASDVVVILMASAAVSALLSGIVVLKERLSFPAVAGTLLAVAGIFVISWSGGNDLLLVANSMLAGVGYGLFSVLVKKFGFNGGLYLTRFLLFFGMIYLAVPFAQTYHGIPLNGYSLLGLCILALLPTVLGFYCTTKALQYLSAAKVQVTELSEPLFAAMLAWLFLREYPTPHFWAGAALVVLGIACMHNPFSVRAEK
ncbi:DMT family transporter [Neisseria sp.]|uniref:DMT family transporter n=1 Tax=Neisseria sp. TaxID=192066 RepID=UPI0026DBD99C|nr:DMT family transporter [Neisseria sp.]MDO4906998.1 DMT family transporter [Neisseria sp.]